MIPGSVLVPRPAVVLLMLALAAAWLEAPALAQETGGPAPSSPVEHGQAQTAADIQRTTGVAPREMSQPARQSDGDRITGRYLTGLGFAVPTPLGAFRSNVGGSPFGGATFLFARRAGESVVSIGGEGSIVWYGSRSIRRVSLGSVLPEVPDAAAEVETRRGIFLLHARVRAQKRTGRFRPYADGLLGFADIFTKSSVKGPMVCASALFSGTTCGQDDLGGKTHSRAVVPSYGGGLGVVFRTIEQSGDAWGGLDVSVRYLRGGTAEYIAKDGLRVEGAQGHVDVRRSRTDMLMVYAGFAVVWSGHPKGPRRAPVDRERVNPQARGEDGATKEPAHDPDVDADPQPTPLAAPPDIERQVARKPTRLQGGFGLLGARPRGAFATFVPDGAGGVSGHVDVSLGHSIISLGLEWGWMQYGHEHRKESLAALIPEAPSAVVGIDTYHAMSSSHVRLRAQPRRGQLRPYVDGLYGLTDIYTTSSVHNRDSCGVAPLVFCDGRTLSRDVVLSYGAGAGVMFGLGAEERAPRLDVSVRYLHGGPARYLVEVAGQRVGDETLSDVRRSRTDMVTMYVGLAFGR